jgi:hypothetical protein
MLAKMIDTKQQMMDVRVLFLFLFLLLGIGYHKIEMRNEPPPLSDFFLLIPRPPSLYLSLSPHATSIGECESE